MSVAPPQREESGVKTVVPPPKEELEVETVVPPPKEEDSGVSTEEPTRSTKAGRDRKGKKKGERRVDFTGSRSLY